MLKRFWAICLGLYLVSQVFFLISIQFPRGKNFDEFHYVPSAKQFMELKENQNWEHPPLGKQIMAVGIALGGDRPLGWRLMSTLFGALTLVGMFVWARAVLRDDRVALWVALLTLCNHLLYVQSRIGMLDTFMFGFMVWAFAFFAQSWDEALAPREQRKRLIGSGVCFGLAMSCKWMAVVPLVFCGVLYLLIRLFQNWRTTFAGPTALAQSEGLSSPPSALKAEWFSQDLWRGLRFRDFALSLGLVPLLAYFVTFLPFLWVHREPAYTLWDLVLMQPKMFDGQLRVVNSHPYMSQWWSWPLMTRPIWYAFDKEGSNQEWVRGVLLVGNPLILWGGLLAVLGCAWAWVTERSRAGFLIFATYAALILCWAVIPRKVAFYYYYYPAGMTLSLALGFVFQRWTDSRSPAWRWGFLAASAAVFIYYFPILSGLRVPAESFRKWMLLSSWI